MAGYSNKKDDVQRRLRRIEGQVRGLQRMVDEDAYCIDVLDADLGGDEGAASRRARAARRPPEHCVADAIAEGGTARAGEDRRGVRGRRAALVRS